MPKTTPTKPEPQKPTLADPLTTADIAKLPMADVRRLYAETQNRVMYHEANDRL